MSQTLPTRIFGPKESAEWIAHRSHHVKLNTAGIQSCSEMIWFAFKANIFSIKSWKQDHDLNPKTMDESSIDWIFLCDTLNFSFWSANPGKKYGVKYNDKMYTGYWSLCAAVNRALQEGIPITSATYMANATMADLERVFRTDTAVQIPLLDKRLELMREAGNVLLKKYDGTFANCIKTADRNAQKLLSEIVANFPSYRDAAVYEGKEVSFYKRAQILIADIWACFEGKDIGAFSDIDTITMFADYRIPQALAYFNVLSYSSELSHALQNERMFEYGDPMEVELRGCSIWAVELIVQEVNRRLPHNISHVNSILVDHYLWDYRRAHDNETSSIPFHRIRCIYY